MTNFIDFNSLCPGAGKIRKEPLVLKSMDKFIHKLTIIIKLLTGHLNFNFTNRKKKAFEKTIMDRMKKNSSNEYLVYNERFGSIRYKIRIFFVDRRHSYSKTNKSTVLPYFQVNLRIHFSNIEKILINIGQQTGTNVSIQSGPYIANYYFFLDLKNHSPNK
jgi:hypothetical protein